MNFLAWAVGIFGQSIQKDVAPNALVRQIEMSQGKLADN